MNSDLYTIIALAARYWFCALMLIIVFRAWRITVVDNRRAKILRAYSPETGSIGELLVNPGNSKRRMSVSIPREGVLGSGNAADVQIKHPDMKKKHAYLEQREDGLIVRPLRGADVEFHGGVTGEQLLMRDGDIVTIGELKLMLVLFDAAGQPERLDDKDPDEERDELFDPPVERREREKRDPFEDFFDEDELWQEQEKRPNAKKKR